ncbi:MAG: hypothetical protein H0V17_19805 [Deltaproteobacteria bacterium]|nr:hypothetical protein [Deltaproteobacteria bacterium]
MRLMLATALAMFACTGTIDGGTSAGDDDDGDPPPTPQIVDIEGPMVLPHVQTFANAVCTDTGACSISTYEGHSPTASRALDILSSDVYGERPTDNNVLGDEVAEHALAHQVEYGITYVIWRQRINSGDGWEAMEDRGSITQNHYDHVHVSFETTAP